MAKKQVDYKNFIKRLGVKNYQNLLIAQEGVPYVYKVGTIDFISDLNDVSVTGTDIEISFTGKKPNKSILITTFFEVTEEISSYTSLTLTSITGQANIVRTEGDVVVDLVISGSNAQDWLGGKIDVYALLMD